MIDPIRLQALVDGECSASERRRMLCQIENQPEQWRELALALLEEQTFRNEIKLMRGTSSPTIPTTTQLKAPSLAQNHTVVRGERSNKPWFFGPILAACLALSAGIAIGRFVMRGDADITPWGTEPSSMIVNTQSAPRGSNELNKLTQEEYERMLPVADLRSDRSGYEIPVYDVNHVDPALVLAKRAYEVEKAKEQLRRNGYDIDLQHKYLTGQLQDGRKVIVPIQEVGLRPYGQ